MPDLTSIGLAPDSPLLLIGCGKMGSALLDGWLRNGLPGAAITIVEPSPADALRDTAAAEGIELLSGADQVTRTPGAVLAAIKPQMMAQIMPGMAERFGAAPLYVSIAAGTPVRFFENTVGTGARVIRVMPNTPSAVGKGASALIANAAATADDRAQATALMEAVGSAVWLEHESQMDAVTGVSGSGPAYVFHMIEALAAAGEAEGLSAELALALARQTVFGAAALAEASDEDAAQLRRNVTSPGGTTAAGLDVLANQTGGLTDLMQRTVAAAAARSRELAG